MKRLIGMSALFFLVLWGSSVGTAETGPLPPSLVSPINDYLGGSDDMTQKLEEALKNYNGPACQLPGDSPGLTMRKAYDALVWVGEILCQLKITCFTKYVRDFFPLPATETDILNAFRSGDAAFAYGRWYQLYGPLELLGKVYAYQKKTRGLEAAESPSLILVYPDISYVDKSTLVNDRGEKVPPSLGDRDVLGSFKEGNLVFHVSFTASTLDQVDVNSADAGEIAKAAAVSIAPGVIFVAPIKGSGYPAQTFLVVGSTAPPDKIAPLTLPEECSGQASSVPQGNYWQLVGQVPYFWNTLMEVVTPMAKTLAEFSQKMNEEEQKLKGGGTQEEGAP